MPSGSGKGGFTLMSDRHSGVLRAPLKNGSSLIESEGRDPISRVDAPEQTCQRPIVIVQHRLPVDVIETLAEHILV